MRKRSPLFLALLVACLPLGACTFARSEVNDKDFPSLAREVHPGVTTQEELLRRVGTPPSQVILMPAGNRLLIYSYGQSKTKGLTLILFNVTKTNAAVDTAIFLVGKDGVIQEMWVGNNSDKVEWEWWAFGK